MKIFGFMLITLLSLSSHAYYSTFDTAETIAPGQYEVGAELNTIFSEGLNLLGRFETGVNDSSTIKALAGFGTSGFVVGGFFKWVPIPDYDKQPAFGIIPGILYNRDDGENFLSLRLTPIVSKKFETENGLIIPYVSLPFGMTFVKGEDEIFPTQFALGAEYKHPDLKKISFIAEVGFELNDAYSYISLGANLQWDDESGFSFE